MRSAVRQSCAFSSLPFFPPFSCFFIAAVSKAKLVLLYPVQDRVGSLGGVPFLELVGFEKDAAGEVLKLDRSKVDSTLLNAAGSELNTAITNPFFGVL